MVKTAARRGVFNAPKSDGPKVIVRTPAKPGGQQVDAAKYEAMKKVVLAVVPKRTPGITQNELMAKVMKVASKETFPKTTSMWWAMCVKLDLEARGAFVREDTKPLRWHRT